MTDMKHTFRIIIMTAVLTISAVAADAQILLGGGGLEPLDRETVITDLSSPAGSGNLFVSISVDYPDGSDSTYYYVTSSQEAACEAAGIELSELTNMMQFTLSGAFPRTFSQDRPVDKPVRRKRVIPLSIT